MVANTNNSMFTLNCTSTDSPATTVIWTKDGEQLPDYLMYQLVRDGVTATYDNLVDIDADVDELVGTYSCGILNSAGLSNTATVTVQGETHSPNLFTA